MLQNDIDIDVLFLQSLALVRSRASRPLCAASPLLITVPSSPQMRLSPVPPTLNNTPPMAAEVPPSSMPQMTRLSPRCLVVLLLVMLLPPLKRKSLWYPRQRSPPLRIVLLLPPHPKHTLTLLTATQVAKVIFAMEKLRSCYYFYYFRKNTLYSFTRLFYSILFSYFISTHFSASDAESVSSVSATSAASPRTRARLQQERAAARKVQLKQSSKAAVSKIVGGTPKGKPITNIAATRPSTYPYPLSRIILCMHMKSHTLVRESNNIHSALPPSTITPHLIHACTRA